MSANTTRGILQLQALCRITPWLIALVLVSGCNSDTHTTEAVAALADETQIDLEVTNTAPAPVCGPKQQYFTVTEYTAIAQDMGANISLTTDGSAAPIKWDSLALTLNATIERIQANAAFKLRFALFNAAYACQPTWEIGAQKVVDISIVSNDIYSEQYPAGSELSHLFTPVYVNSGYYMPEHLPSTLVELFNEAPEAPGNLTVQLTQAPDFIHHTFTITLTMDDGRIYSAYTPPIELAL